MSKELLSSIMAEIKINFSYSYFDFALFKVSPRPIRIMLTRTVILRKHHLCFSNQYTRIACIHKQSGVLGLIRISVYWFQLNTTLQIYVKNKKIKMIISIGWIDEIICVFCKNFEISVHWFKLIFNYMPLFKFMLKIRKLKWLSHMAELMK